MEGNQQMQPYYPYDQSQQQNASPYQQSNVGTPTAQNYAQNSSIMSYNDGNRQVQHQQQSTNYAYGGTQMQRHQQAQSQSIGSAQMHTRSTSYSFASAAPGTTTPQPFAQTPMLPIIEAPQTPMQYLPDMEQHISNHAEVMHNNMAQRMLHMQQQSPDYQFQQPGQTAFQLQHSGAWQPPQAAFPPTQPLYQQNRIATEPYQAHKELEDSSEGSESGVPGNHKAFLREQNNTILRGQLAASERRNEDLANQMRGQHVTEQAAGSPLDMSNLQRIVNELDAKRSDDMKALLRETIRAEFPDLARKSDIDNAAKIMEQQLQVADGATRDFVHNEFRLAKDELLRTKSSKPAQIQGSASSAGVRRQLLTSATGEAQYPAQEQKMFYSASVAPSIRSSKKSIVPATVVAAPSTMYVGESIPNGQQVVPHGHGVLQPKPTKPASVSSASKRAHVERQSHPNPALLDSSSTMTGSRRLQTSAKTALAPVVEARTPTPSLTADSLRRLEGPATAVSSSKQATSQVKSVRPGRPNALTPVKSGKSAISTKTTKTSSSLRRQSTASNVIGGLPQPKLQEQPLAHDHADDLPVDFPDNTSEISAWKDQNPWWNPANPMARPPPLYRVDVPASSGLRNMANINDGTDSDLAESKTKAVTQMPKAKSRKPKK